MKKGFTMIAKKGAGAHSNNKSRLKRILGKHIQTK